MIKTEEYNLKSYRENKVSWHLNFNVSFIGFYLFFIVVQVQFVSIFPSPLSSALPVPTSHPQSYSSLALSMCPSYMFLDDLSPFPPIIPSPLSSGYCHSLLFKTHFHIINFQTDNIHTKDNFVELNITESYSY